MGAAAKLRKCGSSKNEDSVSPRYKWWLVAMLWWIAFFNYADRQAVFSLFPLLGKELHLSQTQRGLLGSSFAWTYGLCAPFAGWLVDRIRRKTAILGGLQAWSLICMATALSRGFGWLVFFRAAEGLGETFYFPASVAMLSDYHGPRTRSRALGIHQTSVYAGTIGGGACAALIAEHYGWRSTFVIFGALGMLLGLLLTRFIVEPARPVSMNWTAIAQRIRPSTRTTMTMPILPNAREIRSVNQNETTISAQTAAITPRPTAVPVAPNACASSA